MRLAVDGEPAPPVGDDVHVRGVDVRVLLDEVVAQDGTEELRGSHRVLLREDVDGVLDGVGGDHDAVIGLGVAIGVSRNSKIADGDYFRPAEGGRGGLRGLDVTLQQHADGHLDHGLDTGLGVLVDLVDADIVLAVAGSSNVRHGVRGGIGDWIGRGES